MMSIITVFPAEAPDTDVLFAFKNLQKISLIFGSSTDLAQEQHGNKPSRGRKFEVSNEEHLLGAP